ncbi:MAG TPA: class I SAM-dependent methyltransferase [Chthoniobacterales bacterium]|jgi:predicted O-methyltransferase YrrM
MSAFADALNLPSRHFVPRQYGLGAWTENLYFAYDLIAQLKPAIFVELGTDRGESYFAFCQSVDENHTGTRCYAVDHWRGDSQSGSYEESTFLTVEAHNRSHYADFSALLRCTFDAALNKFAPESIDLLHIDGHHTEDAVRHDLESWLPKLRPGGILLMHDVTMRGRDFGVWKVWGELTHAACSWTFPQPPGLGIWEKPPSRPLPPLLEILLRGPGDQRTKLLDYYRECNTELQARIERHWRDGSIRSAPMAGETIIQIFWSQGGGFSEENSSHARIGHESWRDVSITLPFTEPISHLRIDFLSPLTTIEIAAIGVATTTGNLLFEAATAREFETVSLLGDCRRISSHPLTLEVTGIDPQLHLPAFSAPSGQDTVLVRMKLRVSCTSGQTND